MKKVVQLYADVDDSVWVSFDKFRRAYNRIHLNDGAKNLVEFKKGMIAFLNTSFSYSYKLLFKNDEVVGSIDLLLFNKGEAEEVLNVRIHVLKEKTIQDFEEELKLEIAQWKQLAKKIKLEVSYKNLMQLLEEQGYENGNDSIWFHLKTEKINNTIVKEFLNKDIIEKNKLTFELNQELKEHEFSDVANLMTILLNDIKRVDRHQTFKETPENIKEIVDNHKNSNSNLFHLLLRNEKEELVGMSIIVFKKDSPIVVNQFMTGVLKEYRGLGLPTWMKAYMYDYLQENYSTVKLIKTDCFAENTPMIHINKKIGFKEVIRTTEMIYENK